MIDQLVIPDDAIKYMLFQRTAYLRFPVAPLYRLIDRLLPFPTPLYNVVVAVESKFGIARIKALYEDDIGNEYDFIKNILPQTCSTVLDIGCGVAGIDVFINYHYSVQNVNFYLLDKSQVENNVFYLFKPQGACYNSLDVARALLTGNGIADQRIHLVEANDHHAINVDTSMDLIISLLSWGFHYPVETYLDRVHELLRADGVVILDVRKGTAGLERLRRRFTHIEIIVESEKYYRVAGRK